METCVARAGRSCVPAGPDLRQRSWEGHTAAPISASEAGAQAGQRQRPLAFFAGAPSNLSIAAMMALTISASAGRGPLPGSIDSWNTV